MGGMKVVLFCGGLGLRLAGYAGDTPKLLIKIGHKPILWHVMMYYAYHGHKDFILCLGHNGDKIKEYFLNYSECLSSNFILSGGNVKLLGASIQDWNITFVDTGLASNIGQRLKMVEGYLEGEKAFLANYGDGLTDLHLPHLIHHFNERQNVATFLRVRPTQSFHVVSVDDNEIVTAIQPIQSSVWINGGFFIFRREIFEYMKEGEELVEQPFTRLIQLGELIAYRHDGFWACLDTAKDKQRLDNIYLDGHAPWEIWARRDDIK